MSWDEEKFRELQKDIDCLNLDGEPVSLDDGARALMLTYYIGAIHGIGNAVSRDEIISRVTEKEVEVG